MEETLSQKYLTYLNEEKKYTEHTVIIYMTEIEYFKEWLEKNTDIDDLTKVQSEHVREYKKYLLEELKIQNVTFNKKLQALLKFYEWLRNNNFVRTNYFNYFKTLKVTNRRKTMQFLYKVEIEKLYEIFDRKLLWKKDWIYYRDLAIFSLLEKLGLKINEIVDLKKDNINRIEMVLLIEGERERTLPLDKDLLGILGDWLIVDPKPDSSYLFTSQKSEKITHNTIHILLNKLKKVSDIEDLTANTLRNTRIITWRREGLGTREVKRRSGHKNTISTRYYFDKYSKE